MISNSTEVQKCFQGLFCVRVIAFKIHAQICKSIQELRKCVVCQVRAKDYSKTLTLKSCICVCTDCKRSSSNCEVCTFELVTQSR